MVLKLFSTFIVVDPILASPKHTVGLLPGVIVSVFMYYPRPHAMRLRATAKDAGIYHFGSAHFLYIINS